MSNFEKWYSMGQVDTYSGEDETEDTRVGFYRFILGQLNTVFNTHEVWIKDIVKIVKKTNPDLTAKKQLILLQTFQDSVPPELRELFRSMDEFLIHPLSKILGDLQLWLSYIKSVVAVHKEIDPSTTWKIVKNFAEVFDEESTQWDGKPDPTPKELIRRIVKAGLGPGPLYEGVVEGLEDVAGDVVKPFIGDLRGLLIVGGAIIGGIIILPRLGSGASKSISVTAAKAEGQGRAISSKAEDQARKVAANIMRKRK